MKRRALLTGMVVAVVLALAAPSAYASDFCVGVSPTSCPLQTHPFTASGFAAAVEAANLNPGPDRVVIAPGPIDVPSGLNVTPDGQTSIIGAGAGQTVFSSTDAVPAILQVWFTGSGGTISGISVNATDEAPGGNALSIRKGTLSDFSVEKSNDVGSVGFIGLDVGDGATARDGVVTIHSNAGIGLHAGYKSATVDRVTLDTDLFLGSNVGLEVDSHDPGAELKFSHVRINRFATGATFVDKHVTFTDSLIDLAGLSNTTAVVASAGGGNVLDLDIARVTVVGNAANQTAFYIYSESAPSAVDVDLYDFIAFAPQPSAASFMAIRCSGGAGPTPVNLDVEYFASWGGDADIGSGCFWDLEGPKSFSFVNDGLPGFRDFDGGDYRLKWDSPLIDLGDTTTSLAGADKDLAGAKRLVDGNGDGIAKPDLGAFEYQRAAPNLTLTASRSVAQPGEQLTFEALATDPEAELVAYSWTFDDGTTAGNETTVMHSFASFGAHTVTATATDEAGASTTKTATVSIPDTTIKPPAIASARVTAKPKKSFKVGKKGFSIAKRGQPSFTVTFADSAKAKFSIKGVKGSQTIAVKNGAQRLTFGGKLGAKKLKAAKYTVTVTPLSPTGKPGPPVSVKIRLK